MRKGECFKCKKWSEEIKQCVVCLKDVCPACSVYEWCSHDYCYSGCNNGMCNECYDEELEEKVWKEMKKDLKT